MTASTTRRLLPRRRFAAAGALAVAGTLLLSACGDQTEGAKEGNGGQKTSDAPLFDELPKKYQDSGVIKVGSDIAYAPIEFMKDGEVTGIDPDIAAAMGKELGVEFQFNNGTFDGLVLGMNSGRYDVIMSAMTDTKERQRGATDDAEGGADFVNYFQAGSAILVAKGNPKKINGVDDLCGKGVAAQRGTANQTLLNDQQKKCDSKIKPFIADQDSDSITQLQTGRVDAVITDYPVALYNALTAGGGDRFEVVGDQIDAAPYGIAVSKKNTELRDALQKALQAIIDNGEYAKVLKKWEAEAGAVEKATVNAGK
ncbi:ABC transporter substrate-binding protein [Streptomyces durbertensis]|uniref:ABC transporter substrate-binding protein n=1 Tax=Streptomyces durbertensis TaxID=2448886 RepID=A0ABR6EMT9_9ACTN|nr:ABC transporter substrate-binding protein [Streptomyces durbertensis]MBB1246210.1 ABC transporter substrate-binding protein [Streptomyces durbertensis]